MEKRKNDKANLEKLRYIFTGIGLVGVIGLVFLAFSYKSYDKVSYDFMVSIEEVQEDLPPLIAPDIPPPPPPPPPKAKPPKEPEIEIVKDDIEVEEEQFDEELDEDIEIEEGPEEDDEPEPVDAGPLLFVKDMPHYKKCAKEKNNAMRDMCTKREINNKIKEAFVYPDIAQDMGLEGTVYVQFVVSSSGEVKDVIILKSVHKYLDEAAVNAVKSLPKLIPGKQLDKPVDVLYKVPVKIEFN